MHKFNYNIYSIQSFSIISTIVLFCSQLFFSILYTIALDSFAQSVNIKAPKKSIDNSTFDKPNPYQTPTTPNPNPQSYEKYKTKEYYNKLDIITVTKFILLIPFKAPFIDPQKPLIKIIPNTIHGKRSQTEQKPAHQSLNPQSKARKTISEKIQTTIP